MATLELPYEKVYDLLHKCCTSISPDVLYLMKRAAAKETNPEAKTFLETMLKNVELAGQMDKPVCQSPGFPSVWIRWGEAMQPNLTNLMGNITQSVIEATKVTRSNAHPVRPPFSTALPGMSANSTMDTVQPSGTLVQLPSRRHLRLASTSMPAEPMF